MVEGRGLSRGFGLVLAAATGLAVANLYYAQPLLHTIGEDLGTSEGRTGLVVTAAQVGYAAGLALLVPLGDLVARRRLIPAVLVAMVVALVGASVAPSLPVLAVALLVVGVGATAAQLMVALTAGLATDGQRGRAVGTVMTGLLLGILLARTVAGGIAGLLGWRAVFVVAAGAAVALAVALSRLLPPDEGRPRIGYGAVLASTVTLLRDLPGLRRSALVGALAFATFSVFWTTISFHLAAAPFGWGDGAIGLLGLVGAAGALCATAAGRLADRGLAGPGRIAAAVAVVTSFGVLWAGRHSIAAVVVGVVVLDVGVQGVQVLNQTIIYELAPEARSRITSAYMTLYFGGGALGSAVGAAAYDAGGWGRACAPGRHPRRRGRRGGDLRPGQGASHPVRSATVSMSVGSPGHGTSTTRPGWAASTCRAPTSPLVGSSSHTSDPRRTGCPRRPS
ncbi:MFS transporter [Iamia sp. SCSIO 61187]|nr:MFS transporter [Iamia sp. SCSIO 61187]